MNAKGTSEKNSNPRGRWLKRLVRDALSPAFFVFLSIALVMGGLAYWVLGEVSFGRAVDSNLGNLASTVPRMFAALLMAGMIYVLLPREMLSRMVGKNSGFRGLLMASAAGIITPGGPASAFPLLALMGGAGADRGVMIAYITAWATLGMQRIVVWDLPIMGTEFTLVRILVSLPLPIIAGLIARRVPIEIQLKEEFLEQAKSGRTAPIDADEDDYEDEEEAADKLRDDRP